MRRQHNPLQGMRSSAHALGTRPFPMSQITGETTKQYSLGSVLCQMFVANSPPLLLQNRDVQRFEDEFAAVLGSGQQVAGRPGQPHLDGTFTMV